MGVGLTFAISNWKTIKGNGSIPYNNLVIELVVDFLSGVNFNVNKKIENNFCGFSYGMKKSIFVDIML